MPDTETIKALKVVIKNREGVPVLPLIETTDVVEEGNNTPVTSHGVKTFLNSFTPNNMPGSGGVGRQIGDIFHNISKIAPKGAYVLDGGIIPECKTRHKQFWNWLAERGQSYLCIDEDTYNKDLAAHGVVLAFVKYDNGDLRLPTWHPGVPFNAITSVRGNGMALGFTDGTKNYGIYEDSSDVYVANFNDRLYGVEVGTKQSGGDGANNKLAQGITPDPAKSGLVAQEPYDPELHGVYCIHVYDEVTPSSKLDADAFTEYVERLMAEMRLQAKVDLTNVTGSADFVVESKVNDDGSWYRLYKSGWVEQGGIVPDATATKMVTVTFSKKMKDTNYFLAVGHTSSNTNGTVQPAGVSGFDLTVESMKVRIFGSDNSGLRWKVEGQAAEVPQWGTTNV
ncbi:MAG: hypothetical protein IJY46_07725 [Lentisphaeria bacterium]|nr:hypothetical protein [Lentisphaeria bacterium]